MLSRHKKEEINRARGGFSIRSELFLRVQNSITLRHPLVINPDETISAGL